MMWKGLPRIMHCTRYIGHVNGPMLYCCRADEKHKKSSSSRFFGLGRQIEQRGKHALRWRASPEKDAASFSTVSSWEDKENAYEPHVQSCLERYDSAPIHTSLFVHTML